jgi:hypothetical protein
MNENNSAEFKSLSTMRKELIYWFIQKLLLESSRAKAKYVLA